MTNLTPRIILASKVTQTVSDLCRIANTDADQSVYKAICTARAAESTPLAKTALDMIVQNMDIAKDEKMPMCQDTGMVIVFVEMGQSVYVDGNLAEAIQEGVRQSYKENYFRASVVRDPISRENTRDNTPAVIYYDILESDGLKITVMPKGFGSENKSALKMLNPSDGEQGVMQFIIDTVKKAGANPCPPMVIGVGVGGTMDKAALLSKQALLRDVGSHNPDPYWANIEQQLLQEVNALNIGAAGFKGGATALGLNILTHPTHIAGLPVAVNIGCHVSRHASGIC